MEVKNQTRIAPGKWYRIAFKDKDGKAQTVCDKVKSVIEEENGLYYKTELGTLSVSQILSYEEITEDEAMEEVLGKQTCKVEIGFFIANQDDVLDFDNKLIRFNIKKSLAGKFYNELYNLCKKFQKNE